MANRLRKRELCPLHRSYFCCGRQSAGTMRHPWKVRQNKPRRLSVERIEDPHHPRGYREICSLAEQRKRKHELLSQPDPHCFYCKRPFVLYDEVDLAHILPKGMGGATRDDHRNNLALAHKSCNRLNGSKRPESAA